MKVKKVNKEQSEKIVQKAMEEGWLLCIQVGAWGNRKHITDDVLVEKFQDDAEIVSATRKLLDCEEIRDVTRTVSSAQSEARKAALPWFQDGTYFFTESKVESLEKMLQDKEQYLKEKAIPALQAVWDERVEEACKKHPKFLKREYYPGKDELPARFRLWWSWVKVAAPVGKDQVRVLGKEKVEREVAKFRDAVKQSIEDGSALARQAVVEVFEYLRDVLRDPNKKFKDSTVEKVTPALERLKELFEMVGDAEGVEMVKDSLDIMDKVEGEDLRLNGKFRSEMAIVTEQVVTAFKAVKPVALERDIMF